MGKYLHPYIELRTLRVDTCIRTHQRRDGLSHYQNLTSLSVFGSILKDFFFLGTDVGKCEGCTFDWGRHDSIHNGYNCTNEKIDSHITKIWRAFRRSVPFWKIFFFGNRCQLVWGSYFWLRTTRRYKQWLQSYQWKYGLSHYQNLTSLSAFGSILKDFWEPVSVNVRVVLLVEDNTTLYTMVTIVSTKRWTLTLPKFDEPFGIRFHFERFFYFYFLGIDVGRCEGRTLVGDDTTLYTMVTIVSTKRWTLTLPKFDEPFGVRFHFERFFFLGTGVN